MRLLARENGFVHVCGHRGHSIAAPENTLAALRTAARPRRHQLRDRPRADQGRRDPARPRPHPRPHDQRPRADRRQDRRRDRGARCRQLVRARVRRRAHADAARGARPASQPAGLGLVAEIKERARIDRLVERLAALLEETGALDDVVLISFDHVDLRRAKERDPRHPHRRHHPCAPRRSGRRRAQRASGLALDRARPLRILTTPRRCTRPASRSAATCRRRRSSPTTAHTASIRCRRCRPGSPRPDRYALGRRRRVPRRPRRPLPAALTAQPWWKPMPTSPPVSSADSSSTVNLRSGKPSCSGSARSSRSAPAGRRPGRRRARRGRCRTGPRLPQIEAPLGLDRPALAHARRTRARSASSSTLLASRTAPRPRAAPARRAGNTAARQPASRRRKESRGPQDSCPAPAAGSEAPPADASSRRRLSHSRRGSSSGRGARAGVGRRLDLFRLLARG